MGAKNVVNRDENDKNLYHKIFQLHDHGRDIDGEVKNESLWSNILPITKLYQIIPNYGSPISERTEIRMAYSNKMLYLSVICFVRL